MLILFVALMLFGGKKLPELARGLGKGIRDFKDASEGVKREINSQIDNFEAKKAEDAAKATAAAEPVVASQAPVIEPPTNSVPVGEIHSEAEVAPAETEHTTVAELPHLKETPIDPTQVTHDEYKS